MMIDSKKNGWGKCVISALFYFLLMGPVWSMLQELTPDEEQAIADAKSDVRKKVPLEWSLLNAALPLVGLLLQNSSGGWCIPSAAAGSLGLVFAVGNDPELPIQRIIGKSPTYLEKYKQVFRERMAIKRAIYALGGCLVSGTILFLLLDKWPVFYGNEN